MSNSSNSQVGGTHYTDLAIQPWEIIEKNNLNYWEGNVIKYLLRRKHENREQDLAKAIHYLQYLLNKGNK